jgi:hypothetical protein
MRIRAAASAMPMATITAALILNKSVSLSHQGMPFLSVAPQVLLTLLSEKYAKISRTCTFILHPVPGIAVDEQPCGSL